MARWEWTKETQEEFQKMQDKCSEFLASRRNNNI